MRCGAQYRELNDAHAAIQRAGRQLGILNPLVDAGSEYRRYEEQMARYETAKSLVPFYVAGKAEDLLTAAIANLQSQHQAQQSHLQTVDAELEALRVDLQDIEFAIRQDDVGRRVREIEGRLPAMRENIEARRTAASRYDENARRLELLTYQGEEAFYQNRTDAVQMRQEIEEETQSLEGKRSENQLALRDEIERGKELDSEITYLRENLSNIPAGIARIRQQISDDLNLPLGDLPFVGELLKVRVDESAWEGAYWNGY
jgi:uncharacterized protein YPO0396